MWSFDFHDIEVLQAKGDWDAATAAMIKAAQSVERGGADCLVICTNTMHKMAGEVQNAIDVPLIHIADATANAIKQTDAAQPLLLATRYTMEQDFYKGRLRDDHAIDVLIPDDSDRTIVHDIIYDELCQGIVSSTSRTAYLEVVARGQAKGADSVIFGCTEVGLLVSKDNFAIPTFDTTELHAKAAIDFALG